MYLLPGVVAHAFNSSTWEAEAGGSLELEASLVYRVSFRTARATQRNPDSKMKQKCICDYMEVRSLSVVACTTGS